jgi:hypothetical protein
VTPSGGTATGSIEALGGTAGRERSATIEVKVLQLRAYAPPERADAIGRRLAALSGVRHLVVGGRTAGGMVELTGEIDAAAADVVLELLRECDLAADDVVLWRASSVQPLGWRRRRGVAARDVAVWIEVMGRAQEHARPGLTYVLYMAAAGVVAGVGVITGSAILVVGAMALSPDLLPISATAVGLVERRYRLALRAILTLVLGLGVAAVAAAMLILLGSSTLPSTPGSAAFDPWRWSERSSSSTRSSARPTATSRSPATPAEAPLQHHDRPGHERTGEASAQA